MPWIDSLNSQKVGVLQYYFSYEDPKDQTAEKVVKSLLKQLTCLLDRVPKELETEYDQWTKRRLIPTRERFLSLLRQCLSQFTIVYIFLDGFDECRETERPYMIALIRSLPTSQVRLFITARSHLLVDPNIRADTQLREWMGTPKVIEIKASEEDIQIYLGARLAKEAKALAKSTKDVIMTKICQQANGLYPPGGSFLTAMDVDFGLRNFN